jgi:hypothetical protein
MNFIVNNIRQSINCDSTPSYRNSDGISVIICELEPEGENTLKIGDDLILCGSIYLSKNTNLRTEITCSISIYDSNDISEDILNNEKNIFSRAVLFENHLDIQLNVNNGIFKTILTNITNKNHINNFSLRFERINGDSLRFGSDFMGNEKIWNTLEEDEYTLKVSGFRIGFDLFNMEEIETYEDKIERESNKRQKLINTIKESILIANETTKNNEGARLFNELKPYLITTVFLLTVIVCKLIF